jgi:hypothetical protein
MSAAGPPQGANRAAVSINEVPYAALACRPPSTLADALVEPGLRPARVDVLVGSAVAELTNEVASVGVL